jgi:hypothetical protein
MTENAKPLCKTERGCPVSDIAPIPQAEKIINTYIQAKTNYEQTGMPEVQRIAFEEVGLLNDTQLLFKFEQIWAKYKLRQKKKAEAKRKAKAKSKGRTRAPRRRRR